MRDHIRIVNPRAYPDAPEYSPLDADRPCARCRQRDRWRHLAWHDPNPGGWYCPCLPVAVEAEPARGVHVCGPSCVLGVA